MPRLSRGQSTTHGATYGRWERVPTVDQLTDAKTEQLIFRYPVESNGRHGEFVAIATCDIRVTFIKIKYLQKFNKNVGFKDTLSRGFFGTIVHQTFVETNINGNVGELDLPMPDFNNEVTIALTPVPNVSGPLRSTVLSGPDVRIEFTLSNGDTPILRFNPQDDAFQKFVMQPECGGPPPPPAIKPLVPGAANPQYSDKAFLKIAPVDTQAVRPIFAMFFLDHRSVDQLIVGSGIDIPPGQDPVQYLGSLCKSDEAKRTKIHNAIAANAKFRNQVYPDDPTTFRPIEPGSYHLLLIGSYDFGEYMEDQVVTLPKGLTVIPFPTVHRP